MMRYIFSAKLLLSALYVTLIISYIHKTFAVMYNIVNEYTYIYSTICVLLVPHGFVLLVPFRKGGWEVSSLFPILLVFFFSISPVILLAYLAGCPLYLQYLVLALSCNLNVLGCHTHVQLHRSLLLWWSHCSCMYIKQLYSMSGCAVRVLRNTVF